MIKQQVTFSLHLREQSSRCHRVSRVAQTAWL